MSLAEFQRAFADLIASPQACLEARQRPAAAFAKYSLTAREVDRLRAIVRDEGMTANCTLYRVNRLVPVYAVLPLTCRLLGAALLPQLERFWAACEGATLQYRLEAWRFGDWLLERLRDGSLARGPLEDVIRFERAAYEVQTAPHGSDRRRQIVSFRYDPAVLLDPDADLSALEPLPHGIELLLDGTSGALEVAVIRGNHRATDSGERAAACPLAP